MFKIFAVITILAVTLAGNFHPIQAKGFKFKTYKSYKSYKQPSKKSTLDHSYNKFKKSKPNTPIFQNQWFKWFIGGMIFGAFISFLMGQGFHIGMPGLLEILLIAFLVYFIYRYFKTKKETYSYQNTR